ncbi:MAG: prepilin peptidase [Deltaproteobacteria bacterium]|nr:prepilin peptidase [Deltaproteobacteria bacterium]
MDTTPLWFPYLLVGLFGLCIGSFLNVCIVRIPHDQSIHRPRSHCPQCRAPIRWFDNIPVFSFLLLWGRCRQCRAPISWRYPLVELLTAAAALAVFFKFPEPLPWAIWFFLFIAPLIAITFIDLEHLIIPDAFSLSGIILGLAARPILAVEGQRLDALLDGLIGVVVGGGFLWLVAAVYERLRKQEGLGGGDVKLIAMLGAFLGWKAVLFILLMSSLLGSLVGVVVIAILRKGLRFAIPFGPFLAVAGILYLFFGETLVTWYLSFYV